MNAHAFEAQMMEWLEADSTAPLAKGIADVAPLGRMGSLIVRLAATPEEIDAAQALRYRVFREGSDIDGRDADRFDVFCEHLIVIDTALMGSIASRIVGTYRMLRPENARLAGNFYSQAEFDLNALAARIKQQRILELGRSCVLPQYRNRRTVELLWQGIWAFCRQWNVKAHKALRVNMDLMPAEAIDLRTALNAMPPLVKGYLRVGAMFGEGAVVDHEFGTTDVFVILPVAQISNRYVAHYGAEAERFA